MKKFFTHLSVFLICCISSSIFGQNTIINNFETGSPAVVSRYGVSSNISVVPNPAPDGLNSTANCAKIGRTSSNWYELFGFPTSFMIPANTKKYLHMRVNYYAQPDISIRIDAATENNDGGDGIRAMNKYTDLGHWQDLVFEMDGGSGGRTVSAIIVLPDMGWENSPAGEVLNDTDKFGYIDEISISNSAISDTAVPVVINPNKMVNNFETGSQTSVSRYGNAISVVPNPSPAGLNTTAHCAKISRTTGNWYELFGFPTSFIIPANTKKYLHMKVNYPAQPDISIRIDAANANSDGSADIRAMNKYTDFGNWQDLVFEINGGSGGRAVYAIIVLPDLGFENSPGGQVLNNADNSGYIDEISVDDIPAAPAYADVSYCKGAPAVALTAIPYGTNMLKWYTTATIDTALPAAPTPLTAKSGVTTYFVAQVTSAGFTSPRSAIDVTVTTDVVPSAPTVITGTASQGALVGTATTASYTVTAVANAVSYVWTVPTGMNIVSGQGTATVTVNFNTVAAGIGSIGNLSVAAVNAAGCNSLAKILALTKVLPLAPAAIIMNDLSVPAPVSGVRPAVTSFAKYMGTNTVLRLTATPSLTATSYQWDLPAGVNQVSGGTTNVITVNFAGVTSANTDVSLPVSTNVLRIGVKAVNGVGVSTTSNTALVNPTTTSTGKLLALTAVRPAAPTLKMLDMAVSSTVAVTDISKYIGTNTPLTLVGTVAATTLASSFSWELAEGVNVVAGSVLTSSSIIVNFEDVASGTASLYVGIKAVNGMGSSVKSNTTALPATGSTATLLKLTAGLPSAAGVVVGSLAICSNQASSVTYTITTAALKTNLYNITAPVGTTIVGGVMNTRTINAVAGATFTVNYPNGFTSVIPTQKKISIQSVNGFGVSVTNKVLLLTSKACITTARIAKAPQVATDFKVIAYPNPSSGVFNLAIESSNTAATTIQVYDMQGRMIENKQVNTNAVELGGNYTSGIYNVILENAGQAKTIRLIKK